MMNKISRNDIRKFKRLGFVSSGGFVEMSKFENPNITPLGVLEYFMNKFQTSKVEYMPIEHHATYFKRGNSRMNFDKGSCCYIHGNILFIGIVEEKQGHYLSSDHEDKMAHIFGAFYKIPKD